MGLTDENLSAIDYMLGTIFCVYCLLFKFNYLSKIDTSGSFNLLLNSENNNKTVSLNKYNKKKIY
jgi:hypothetical protein